MVNDERRREGAQLLLRFPERSDLKDRLEEHARQNKRSLTAEIIHRLEASLNGATSSPEAGKGLTILDLLQDLYGKTEVLEARVSALEASKAQACR